VSYSDYEAVGLLDRESDDSARWFRTFAKRNKKFRGEQKKKAKSDVGDIFPNERMQLTGPALLLSLV
jgi:hypothetical protein